MTSDLHVYVHNNRPAPAVDDQPRVSLTTWRIFEFDLGASPGELRIVAVLPSGSVRTTTALQGVEPATRIATTSSGRQYELLGSPTEDPLAQLKICAAVALSGGQSNVDVSEQIWTKIAAAAH